MKNNKGFSLVELILVIAIMAILVGVMAPQLIKYIEKTNVSSDTQLCDSIKTAITTAMMDPSVVASSTKIPDNPGMLAFTSANLGDTVFNDAVEEILGFSIDKADDHLKSTYNGSKASGIQFAIAGANSVHVEVKNSDATGKKGKGTSSTTIYVD